MKQSEIFAQSCNTYSKRADQYIEGVYAEFYEDFKGIDFVCGLGSNLIGWQNNFSLPSRKENELGQRIKALFPCVERMKIVKTGSAACSAAVRIARAYTGRSKVVGSGYHGSDNWTIAAEKPGTGTVNEGYVKYPSIDEIKVDDQTAAVIVEPVQLDLDGVSLHLNRLKDDCRKHGAVLIFDEVITGFRFLNYSVANCYSIQPDIICLGKALGNGYPIAIVGGRAEIMETPGYFISNTHNGELSAIEESLRTLDYLTEDKLQQLWELGAWFQKEFNAINPKIQIKGYPTRGELQGEEEFKALFMQEAYKAGFFFGRAWFLNFEHTREQLEQAIATSKKIFDFIDSGSVQLEGFMPRPLFRRN